MSQLPNAASALLDDAKITNYLLDSAHPNGAPKEKFFTSFGFSKANWLNLKNALLNHPLIHPVSSQSTTTHGKKYSVSCSLASPDGRNPCVVSVWIIEPRQPNPRFVTAYAGP